MKKDKIKFQEKAQKMVTFVNNDRRKAITSPEVKGDKPAQPEDKSASTDPARRGTSGATSPVD